MATQSVAGLFVAIVLGSESDAEVMQHTVDVLRDHKIPHEIAPVLCGDPGLLAYIEDARSRGLGMIVVGTYYAYTEETIPGILEITVPIVKVITGPVPSSADQVMHNKIAYMGFGSDGARNAGLFAVRVLAP